MPWLVRLLLAPFSFSYAPPVPHYLVSIPRSWCSRLSLPVRSILIIHSSICSSSTAFNTETTATHPVLTNPATQTTPPTMVPLVNILLQAMLTKLNLRGPVRLQALPLLR